MSDTLLQATLQFSEELLCKRPEDRNEEDILRILPWIRHRSTLFKNLEDDILLYVIKHVQFIKVKKDHVIVRQGEKGNCFYVILKGAVSVYARKEDDYQTEYHHHHDNTGAVRSTQERLAYFGTELGNLKSGRTFGEMVLMSDKKERNATVIADELTELIIINEELYKNSFHVYNLEWKEKSTFALACPLFASWPTALKALLIENLKMHKIQFGNRVVEQGTPCNSVYFIAKGAAKVLSDPRKCKEQYEAFKPKKRGKKKELNYGGEEENIELNAIEDLVRPLTVIEKRRRRMEHGFVAMETRLRQREIQATTIGPNDIIGDVEMVLDIPEYCASVECVETLEVYELDKASFQRLIARRSPETLALLRKVVISKLRLRVQRFNEIPLFKYLFERATAAPQNETAKAMKKRNQQLQEIRRPLDERGRWKPVLQKETAMATKKRNQQLEEMRRPLGERGRWKTIKAAAVFGGLAAKMSESASEKKGEATYKEKEPSPSEKKRRERKRSERKETINKQYTSEEFRALKKKMQAQGKMIRRVSD